MAANHASAGPRWTSNLAFVLAAAGTAVGLGNLWRFPFVAGENGGGAFVLVYLAAVAAIAFPIMLAELLVGRRGRGDADQAVEAVRAEAGASTLWRLIGRLSILIPFIGIGYYSVVAGWVVDYTISYIGAWGFHFTDPETYQDRFSALLGAPARLLILHALFMAAVIAVVARGVERGIERVAVIAMPALFVLLVLLVGYAAVKGNFAEGLAFLLAPDFSELSWRGALIAVGQAFFSLAIGIGAMITFGAYLPDSARLPLSAGQICLTDTAVALLAGLAIFPIVFALGLDPAEGPGLIFVTLPAAFDQMPGGTMFGSAFFILLFFAAFTTGIGTLEPVVRWLVGRGLKRPLAAAFGGGAAWFIGAAAALSFNAWEGIRPLALIPGYEGLTIFDALDFSIASLLLPINGLLIALFAGWALPRALLAAELGSEGALLDVWRLFVRILAPAAIVLILVFG